MNFEKLNKNIYSGAYRSGHCQGIAVDLEGGYIYYSFTTMLVKTDLDGAFVGSVTGLLGHLGCIVFNREDGRVYGSLEYKNDAVGQGILSMLGSDAKLADKFYISVFDVDKIDRADMPAEGIMRSAYLSEVVNDYSAKVTLADGREAEHRYGCSGIDGCAIGPDFGAVGGDNYLFVAYGVYSDTSRDDNDYNIILKYSISDILNTAATLDQADMHTAGPTPLSKYFVYTGNTEYGVQNLEYDAYTEKYYLAVYSGHKDGFPNPTMFAVDANIAPVRKALCGIYPAEEGEVISLDSYGLDGYPNAMGDTGLASLGEGYFYVSHDAKGEDGQYTNVKLHKLVGNRLDTIE